MVQEAREERRSWRRKSMGRKSLENTRMLEQYREQLVRKQMEIVERVERLIRGEL